MIASIVGITAYGWLIYTFPLIVLQATAFIAVAILLGILAWIGWTMATMPPPTPLDLESASNVSEPELPSKDEQDEKHN